MQATITKHLVLLTLVAVMVGAFSGTAQAQGSPLYALDLEASLALDTAPPPSADAALRLRTLGELEARDAVLSHRLKGYGVGLAGSAAVVGVGFGIIIRNLCIFGCDAREQTLGTFGGALIMLGSAGALVSTTGLITVGTRRHRVRRRVETLTLTPIASVTQQGTVGGASLQLTW